MFCALFCFGWGWGGFFVVYLGGLGVEGLCFCFVFLFWGGSASDVTVTTTSMAESVWSVEDRESDRRWSLLLLLLLLLLLSSTPPPPPFPSSSGFVSFLFLFVVVFLSFCNEDRLVGPVVKESASRAGGPGFESRLRRDFFGVESYQ